MKKRPPVAWWNKEFEREERIMRAEYRKLRSFQLKRAITQRLFRKARKNT